MTCIDRELRDAVKPGPSRLARISRPVRWAIGAGAALGVCLATGFVLFASLAMRPPEPIVTPADAIVVLTGGEARLAAAGGLLSAGKARRLLISGVNRKTSREDLMRLTGLDRARFACCVEVGYEALDTIGNAAEARAFAARWHIDRLIVVTAGYHMPRSLVEFARALPGATLMPHPVHPPGFRLGSWWLNPGVARVLGAEYLKLLPSAARLAMAWLVPGADRRPVSIVTGRSGDRI